MVGTVEYIIFAINLYIAYWLWTHGHKIMGFIFLIFAIGALSCIYEDCYNKFKN